MAGTGVVRRLNWARHPRWFLSSRVWCLNWHDWNSWELAPIWLLHAAGFDSLRMPSQVIKTPYMVVIFIKVGIPRDQTRSCQAYSDLPSKVIQCLFWNILLLTQGQLRFSREGDCRKLWILGICEHLCVCAYNVIYGCNAILPSAFIPNM